MKHTAVAGGLARVSGPEEHIKCSLRVTVHGLQRALLHGSSVTALEIVGRPPLAVLTYEPF